MVEFSRGDSRKPQLSATVSAPLSDLQRRRSSGSRPSAVVRPDEIPPGLRAPAETPAARHASSVPRAVQKLRATDAFFDEQSVTVETDDSRPLDLRWLLGAAAGLCALALVLPAGVGDADQPVWRAVSEALPVPWSAALTGTVWACLLALLGGAVLWATGQWSAEPKGERADHVAVVTLLLALVALLLRGASDPELMRPAMWPMRSGLLGLPIAAWSGLAAAGLVAMTQSGQHRLARMVAGTGAAVLFAAWWMPIGWIGQSRLPISAALSVWTSPPVAPGADMVTGPMMSAPGLVVLSALAAPALLALLAWPKAPGRWLLRGAAVAILLLGSITPLVAGEGAFDAALGAVLMSLGLGCLVVAVISGVLARMDHVVDDDFAVVAERAAVTAILACFVILKINGMRYSATDEGIYFYAAKAWAEGTWPYHDFFFSHPPLHIGVPAALFALVGFSFTLAKGLSALAAAVTGIAVWRIARRYYDPMIGVAAMALFLLAAAVLKASTNLTGVNLTTMWMMLAAWALLSRKDFAAGLLFGAAVCTGIYAAGVFLALFVLLLFAPRLVGGRARSLPARIMSLPLVQLSLGFITVFGTVALLGHLLAGDAYYEGVYHYHFLKRAKTPGFVPLSEGLHAIPNNVSAMLGSRDFSVSLYYHAAHYWLALLAPAGVAIGIAMRRFDRTRRGESAPDRGPRRTPSGFAAPDVLDAASWDLLWHPRRWWLHMRSGGLTMIMTFVAVTLLVEFAQFKERYDFYYTLLLPVIALLAAGWLHALARMGRTALGCGWAWRPDEDGVSSTGAFTPAVGWIRGVAAGALVLSLLWVPVNMWANQRVFPSEFTARKGTRGAGERLEFDWLKAPGPEAVSSLTRHFFWKTHRLRGNIESATHHYLWSKKRWYSTAEEIAAYIRDNSERSDTITGSSTHAPTVALLADRRMAADHVDTNAKTFKTGVVSEADFWNKVCQDKVKFIVAGPRSWFSPRYIARKPTIRKHFRLVREFHDPHLKHWRSVRLQLWQRIQPYGRPTTCAWVPPGADATPPAVDAGATRSRR